MKQKTKLKKQQIGSLHTGGGGIPSGGPLVGTGIALIGGGVADNRVGVADSRGGVIDNRVGVADNRGGVADNKIVAGSRGDSSFDSTDTSGSRGVVTHTPQGQGHTQSSMDNVMLSGLPSQYLGSSGGPYHHHNKHLNKIKMETDRVSKRSSSDVGLIPSVKRKYRRRKLLSSDESSSSESLSVTSELAHHQMLPSPPIASSQSPAIFHEEKRLANEDVMSSAGHVTNEMDCGNLDLLASVTQRVDKVDGLSKVPFSSTPSITVPAITNEPPPAAKMRNSPVPSVTMATTSESKETVKRNTSVSVRSGGGGSRKKKTIINTNTNNQQPNINNNRYNNNTIQCNTIQCNTIQYNTILSLFV